MLYSYGPLQMAVQKQGGHLEPTYSRSVRIRGVALGNYRKRWTIRRCGERGSGISVLMSRQHDDMCVCVCVCTCICLYGIEDIQIYMRFLYVTTFSEKSFPNDTVIIDNDKSRQCSRKLFKTNRDSNLPTAMLNEVWCFWQSLMSFMKNIKFLLCHFFCQ